MICLLILGLMFLSCFVFLVVSAFCKKDGEEADSFENAISVIAGILGIIIFLSSCTYTI